MNNKSHPLLSFLVSFLLLLSLSADLMLPVPVQAADVGRQPEEYRDYRRRFEGIETMEDIENSGFYVVQNQIFPIPMETFGEVSFVPAYDLKYMRLAVFLVDADGRVVYKTDQLDTNNRSRGVMRQPNQRIAAVSFQDMNEDGLTDIGLITYCSNVTGSYGSKLYKVGDVLFQTRGGFYRDYRISDKINRFSMNKSIEMMVAFIRDGYSTEFLYTATTLEELRRKGLQIISEQHYTRNFEKLGTLEVVPGTYSMANYDIFMIYLVNDEGYIVWSLQPMGDYDNLYALKGMACRDIDGDGLRDLVVLARYSYESTSGRMLIDSDYSIYYQRTDGFSADTEYKKLYRCLDEDTMAELIQKARSYWGWPDENGGLQ